MYPKDMFTVVVAVARCYQDPAVFVNRKRLVGALIVSTVA